MSVATELHVKCEDFLKDNSHLYAHKARRKKIALVGIEVTVGNQANEVRMDLANATLVADEKSYDIEQPDRVIRKLSEFTWDFLVFLVLDFHPLLSVIDVVAILCGPLYNRRLRKQLRLLSSGEIVLRPGECKKAILAFRGVAGRAERLLLDYRHENGEPQRIACEIG